MNSQKKPANLGSLVLVATPIGNLGDISLPAIETLRTADLIACEDTRHTRKLLTHHGISGVQLIAVHEHNEQQIAAEIAHKIHTGATVALVTDAGMPTISDPGERVVVAVVEAGLDVSVIPGASAAIAALAVSGLPADRFCFEGFLPRKPNERRKVLRLLIDERRTMIFYESPHRVASAVADLADIFGDDRQVVLVRELTKLHEEVCRMTAQGLRDRLADSVVKGECVLVVEGATPSVEAPTTEVLAEALRVAIEAGESKRDAAASVAEQFDVSKRTVYEVATQL